MTIQNSELLEALDEAQIKRLETLASQLPKVDDIFIKEFKRDPNFAKECIDSELEEYSQTGEIKYLLSTLKDVAAAKGWVWLAKETGLSRPTLYETLNGKSFPRIDTLAKILNALGFRMLFVTCDNTKIVKKTAPKRSTAARTKKQDKQLQHA